MLENLLSFLRRESPELVRLRRFRARVKELEREAKDAPPDRRARLYNQVGDLCMKEGEYERALSRFGRAIDAYVEAGHLDAAPALCQKVIRLAPDVVRTRATLATLLLANGLHNEAEQQIGEYVHAARAAEQEALASRRLQLMAAATANEHVRITVGEYLLELDDAQAADAVFGDVLAERNGLKRAPATDDHERVDQLLHLARMGPAELVTELPLA
ncbi:MAG TPA: hypothetical protein VFX29_00975 [Longimicrobiaceae bacterium]|jgi:tetratricopeptide (TPR) repeat protein|nr:hypothetical protein [Longimicrobiaceae bacterium]